MTCSVFSTEYLLAQPVPQTGFEQRADSLLHVAKAMISSGAAEEGLALTQELEGEIVATLGKSHWLLIRALVNEGNYFEGKFEFEKAIEKWHEAIALMDTLFQGDHALYNPVLGSIGVAYNNMGQSEKAEEILVTAKTNILNASEPNQRDLIQMNSNLGYVYIASAQTEKAERAFLDARELCKMPEYSDVSTCMAVDRGLGTIYMQTGRLEQSSQIFDGLYRQMLEKGMGNTGSFAALVINMGIVNEHLGNLDRSLELYQEAKDIWEKLTGKLSVYYLICVQNMGVVYARKNEMNLAIQYFEETSPILEQIAGKNSRENYSLKLNLGNAYSDIGDYKTARQWLEETVQVADSTFGPLHEYYATATNSLAWNYEHLGLEAEAISTIEKSCRATTSCLAQAVSYLTEEELEQYMASLQSQLDDPFRMAHNYASNTRASRMAYNYALFLKGYLLGAVIKTRKTAQAHAETRNLYQQYQEKNKALAEQLSLPLSERMGQDELEESIYALKKEMILTLGTLEFEDRQADWEAIQKQLPPESAAIEMIDYMDQLDPGENEQKHYYSALVLRSDGTSPVFVRLCTQAQLDSIVNFNHERKSDYVNQLYTIADRGFVISGKSTKTLYDLLIQPLEAQLSGIKTIYYSPSGLLHRINLDAIPISDLETVADQYQVIQLTSTRQIIVPNEVNQSNHTAVLFGGIDFDQTGGLQEEVPLMASRSRGILDFSTVDSTLRGGSWSYLAGTEREVNTIEKIVQSAGLQPVLKMGSAATEESFKEIGTTGTPSPRMIHLATHGYFFPDPVATLDYTDGGEEEESEFQRSSHPMLRSGLILAGGNLAWQGNQPEEGKEDGILTAYEISQMDLSHTELVVLSACETGLGDIQGNEGVYGLQRAFKIAGARYLIMSLWQVPDKQTSLLMSAFYRKWLGDEMQIPDAFHAAQQQLRENGMDPYYWAGFVLVE